MAKSEKTAETASPAGAPATAEQLLEQPAASSSSAEQPAPAPSAELLPAPTSEPGPVPSELDDAIPGLWVRSVPPTFRRCGFAFTREGIGIALRALDEEQVELLVNEPNLVVEHTVFTEKVRS